MNHYGAHILDLGWCRVIVRVCFLLYQSEALVGRQRLKKQPNETTNSSWTPSALLLYCIFLLGCVSRQPSVQRWKSGSWGATEAPPKESLCIISWLQLPEGKMKDVPQLNSCCPLHSCGTFSLQRCSPLFALYVRTCCSGTLCAVGICKLSKWLCTSATGTGSCACMDKALHSECFSWELTPLSTCFDDRKQLSCLAVVIFETILPMCCIHGKCSCCS